jgi:hypothetical protein
MQKRKLKIKLCALGLYVGLGMWQSSCNKEEPIPSYIHISQINLTTNYSTEGSSKEPKILDAWVYIDGNTVGAFEMPFTVPVLFYGTHTLRIFPGIKENGIAETRIAYPFYALYQQTVNLTAQTITTISPTTTYLSSTNFIWLEDFEGSSPSICDTTNSDTVMKIITSDVFEGVGSGGVFLESGKTKYTGISCNKFVLSKNGSPIFLELHYKTNTEFQVGIIGYDSNNLVNVQTTALTLRPIDVWNKVYVNLTDEVTSATNSVKFAIFFSMLKNPDLSTSYFYLDNVKLLN